MDILDDFPEKKNNDSVRWNYFRKEKPIPESEQLTDLKCDLCKVQLTQL